MKMQNSQLFDLRDMLNSERNLQSINVVTDRFLNSHGYNSFTYGYACISSDATSNPSGIIMESTMDQGILDIYSAAGGIANDPIAERVFTLSQTEIFDNESIVTDTTSRFYRHPAMEAFVDLGYGRGALTPIKSNMGAGSFLAWPEKGLRHEQNNILAATMDDLMPKVAGLYHEALHRDKILADSFSLTVAELDALSYTAHGYSASDVSDKLKICERAVEKRLERARKKLGASNTSNAVFRSAIHNLI